MSHFHGGAYSRFNDRNSFSRGSQVRKVWLKCINKSKLKILLHTSQIPLVIQGVSAKCIPAKS